VEGPAVSLSISSDVEYDPDCCWTNSVRVKRCRYALHLAGRG
jgi:hypothetical protein